MRFPTLSRVLSSLFEHFNPVIPTPEIHEEPANENKPVPASKRRKARRKHCSRGDYLVKSTGRISTVLHLLPEEATSVGLQPGQHLSARIVDGNLVIRQADKGAVLAAQGHIWQVRFSGVVSIPSPVTSVTLHRGHGTDVVVRPVDEQSPTPPDDRPDEGEVLAPEADEPFQLSFLDDFETLQGRAGEQRLKFLAQNDNEQQDHATTSAGDQCYTPLFLLLLILRAAQRDAFDLDPCSMSADGDYAKDIDPSSVKDSVWDVAGQQLPVIGPVPALRRMTREVSEMGSLLLPWLAALVWLNPPYSRRLWAVFLEKAAREVVAGRTKLAIALVPMDTFGRHIGQMFGENTFRIELSEQLPFFMKRKVRGNGRIDRNVVETIKGNSLVIFGKGAETKEFLGRLVGELEAIGYITRQQASHYRQVYAQWPSLNKAA